MSDTGRGVGTSIKLPGPDDDATPFVLRCHVKSHPFKSLQYFDLNAKQDEYKLYVWRSATLRDIACMLHMRDSSLSSANSVHFFRILTYDSRRGMWSEREAGSGVTRISKDTFEEILSNVIHQRNVDEDAFDGDREENTKESSSTFQKMVARLRPQMSEEAQEESAKLTLDELGFTEGDILDCVIKGSTSLTMSSSEKRSKMQSWESNSSHPYGRDSYGSRGARGLNIDTRYRNR